MKILKTTLLAASLAFCFAGANAQNSPSLLNEPDHNKPKIFSDLPTKMLVPISQLESLLSLPVGAQVSKQVTTQFALIGKVVSKSTPGNNAFQSVVVNSTTRNGATFAFSRRTQPDGSVIYTGRMLSRQAGDVLVLHKEGDKYYFSKQGLYDLVNE